MPSPWLAVPLSDYEGHMASDPVGQLAVLSELFGEVLGRCQPASVAILGVAGGNGLEHVDPAVTGRVVGIDLNPEYLAAARERFGALPGLELICGDLAEGCPRLEPVALVHAALVFEHTGLEPCLERAVGMVAPGGRLSVVLQLPSETAAGVSATPFASIQQLKQCFALIDAAAFREALAGRGWTVEYEERRELPAGKAFWLAVFHSETGTVTDFPFSG